MHISSSSFWERERGKRHFPVRVLYARLHLSFFVWEEWERSFLTCEKLYCRLLEKLVWKCCWKIHTVLGRNVIKNKISHRLVCGTHLGIWECTEGGGFWRIDGDKVCWCKIYIRWKQTCWELSPDSISHPYHHLFYPIDLYNNDFAPPVDILPWVNFYDVSSNISINWW